MLVTEPKPNLAAIVAQAIDGGVDIVYWRDKSPDKEALRVQAAELRAIVRAPAQFVVNGRMASEVEADGVQLTEAQLRPTKIHRVFFQGPTGFSVHSVLSARQAEAVGAAYVVAGTIFASQSHPEIEPAGLRFLWDVCAAVSIPVLAIGGITPERVKDCLDAGASGVAILSPIMHADDPYEAARQYRQALDSVPYAEELA